MKKFLIFICLIFVPIFCVSGYCSEQSINNTYHFQDLADIENEIGVQESTLESYLYEHRKNHGNNKENSKMFAKYVLNIMALDENLKEIYFNNDISINDSDLHLDKELVEGKPSHFIDINSIYLIYGGGGPALAFNYEYILEKYYPHLDSAGKTYIKYSMDKIKDIEKVEEHDGDEEYYDMSMELYKKWNKKWTLFTIAHPDFLLNEQIKTDINTISQAHTETVFNIKNYLLCLGGIGFLVFTLFGMGIYFIKKLALITKLKVYIHNKATMIVKSYKLISKFIMAHKKEVIFSLVGIALIIAVSYSHSVNSIPQCDSKFAEETVIQIFKQKDTIYEHNIENVANIKMSEFTPVSYDKDINKYRCEAKLTMYANPDTPIYFLGAYKSFKYNVSYDIYKERGKNTAKASWEMFNIGAQESAR